MLCHARVLEVVVGNLQLAVFFLPVSKMLGDKCVEDAPRIYPKPPPRCAVDHVDMDARPSPVFGGA